MPGRRDPDPELNPGPDPNAGRGPDSRRPDLNPGPELNPDSRRPQRSPGHPAADAGHVNRDGGTVRSPRRPKRDARNVDGKVGRIAGAQEGVIAHDQLRQAGVGDHAIRNWLRRGRLLPKHRGVYVLAHEAVPKYAEEKAAVLACRPRALINSHTAAYMWGYRPKPRDGVVDVIVVGRKARQRRGIRVHRTATLMKADLRRINSIPVVSPARALLEIAPDLTDHELELALHEALALKRVTIAEVRAVLKRYPHRPGSARLAALADPNRPGAVTDSKAAERLRRHLLRSGMPAPAVDHRIGRWRPDFYWQEANLAVEVDGGPFHSSTPRIERDHRKDGELKMKRIEVFRFTGRQVYRELEFVLVTIARAYERRVIERSRSGLTAAA